MYVLVYFPDSPAKGSGAFRPHGRTRYGMDALLLLGYLAGGGSVGTAPTQTPRLWRPWSIPFLCVCAQAYLYLYRRVGAFSTTCHHFS